MSDVMIEAQGLGKKYGPVTAIENVSFEVRKGEVVGFLGPNGAGKTTTMKILTCFIAPTEGSAKVNGADVFQDSLGVRRSIGYLPESTPLYIEMTVVEYLDFIARMRGLSGQDGRARMKKAIEETGLGDVVGKEIRALSKGYRQRVGLAQALVHEPPILILDEPMSGLDPNQAVEIRDLIRDLGKERTVILSTHNLAEVQVACDRVLIIAKGKIVADASTSDLRHRGGHGRYIVSVLISDASQRDKVEHAVRSVSGVDRINVLQGGSSEISLEVIPNADRDLRSDLSKAVSEAGATIVGLSREEQNLESVFRELTLGQ